MSGWDRVRPSRAGRIRLGKAQDTERQVLRNVHESVRLGHVHPQQPGHRTIYCNERERNSISTTKYNILTFLPKGLFEQFRRVANLYFLMISILSTTPISPVHPVTNVVPLSLVLCASLIKEAFEDWKRFTNDKVINGSLIEVIQDGKWVKIPWRKLQVGDLVRVKQDEFFPADLLFLASTNHDGICYTETANLDGETNLKIRKALERTWDYLHPDKASEFKGCSLRNTEFIVGAVIFTGHETKVMMNTMNVPSKRSTLERKLDKLILILFGVLFMMCLIGAIGRRTPTTIRVRESHIEKMGKIQDVGYEILNVLEFNSTRKCQSVICRYPTGRLVLYCKGADSVIYEKIAAGNNAMKRITREHLEQFGAAGLRTLCLAYRDLSNQMYEDWNEKFIQAKSALREREKKLDEVADLIEKELILIGCTAIEDKLQDGVPACIETLSKAGIKIWVLTGDKMETAINIAYACSLISNDMKQFIISSDTKEVREVEDRGDPVETAQVIENTVKRELDKYLEEAEYYEHSRSGLDLALVIDGKCLMYALDPQLRGSLLKLSMMCKAVVCCRVSPLQKAQVVAYFFYKNLTFTLTQFWFTFRTGFSGQRFYDDLYQSLYNVIFTALPVIVVGIFDKDVSASLSKKYPQLYREGIKNMFFKWRVLAVWAFFAIYQSVIFFYFTAAASTKGQNSSGKVFGLWDVGTMAFTCVVITVNLRLLMACSFITKWHNISVGGSILAWFLFIFVYSGIMTKHDRQENIYFVIYVLMSTWYFWLTVLLVPLVALLGDFVFQGLQRWFAPYDYQILQEKYRNQPEESGRLELIETPIYLTEDEERSLAIAQLPLEMSKHTGFAFDSPGYESFFALQQGVVAPHKAWDVARRASMKAPRRTLNG